MTHTRFTTENQPSQEAREKAAKTRSLKLQLNVELSSLTINDVFTNEELKLLHKNYLPKYADFEEFKKATAVHLIAYNFLKYVTQYSVMTNSENATKILKVLDNTTIDDLKEALNPVLNFDKYESLI